MSIVVNPIKDITVAKNAANSSINLFRQFDDPLTTGLVAQFKLYDSTLGGGVSRVVLFDQPGKGAPVTVQNFQNYVNDGDYRNSIIHRAIPGFVIQGGGFVANGVEEAIAQDNPPKGISLVPTDDEIQNEFSRQRSNVRGTIAMAKLATGPDTATSQWFFNLADNSANLDTQNGGFTVFGAVMSRRDLKPIDAIATLPAGNVSGYFNQGALTNVPFINPPQRIQGLKDRNFVRYSNITVNKVDELQFKVLRNSNSSLVDARINRKGALILDYQRNQTGRAQIMVQARNLLGEKVEDKFLVQVRDGRASASAMFNGRTLAGDDALIGTAGDDTLKGRGGDDLLEGGQGNDVITTGSGGDIIAIGPRDGWDTITDFHDGRDRIQLTGSLSVDELSIRQQSDHTLVQLDRSPLLVLENVNAATVNQSDFI